MKTLYQLKSDNHPVITKLFNIDNGITESNYETSVFGNKENFLKNTTNIYQNLIGNNQKVMVNTRLIPEKPNMWELYFNEKSNMFGIIFIDYIKKNPLLIMVASDSSYESCLFINNKWDNGQTEQFISENINDMINKLSQYLLIDINKMKIW